ncbi:hypothetical protein NQ318_013267, partial [Aromia moschata]
KLEENGEIVNSDKEITNIFARHYKKQYNRTLDPNFVENHFKTVNDWYQEYFNTEIPNGQIKYLI